jgi:hypothetical protein
VLAVALVIRILGAALFRGSAPFWTTWLPKIRRWR